MTSKRILIIGGTGAQGFAVVEGLLKASPPFKVRVLSRNPDLPSIQEKFAGLPVDFVKGSFMDFDAIKAALQNCYGPMVYMSILMVRFQKNHPLQNTNL